MKAHGSVWTRVPVSLALVVGLLAGACGDSEPKVADAAGGVDSSVDAASAPDVGVDAAPDTSPDVTPDLGPAGDVSPDVSPDLGPMCTGPIAGCAGSGTGKCDPVCQAGCGCQQRCAMVSGSPACLQPAAMPIDIGEACDATADNCRAGALCLEEAEPVCGAHCYRFCRSGADCPAGALCSIEVDFGGSSTSLRACSAPAESCDPTGEARCMRAGRPLPTYGCYVMSADAPNAAVCDCAGIRKLGDSCQFEHECLPGLECVRGSGASVCRRVCRLGVAGSCPDGVACAPLGTKATVFGYCTP